MLPLNTSITASLFTVSVLPAVLSLAAVAAAPDDTDNVKVKAYTLVVPLIVIVAALIIANDTLLHSLGAAGDAT